MLDSFQSSGALAHVGGFDTLDRELSYAIDPSTIRGAVPASLEGTLFRNGPGRNRIGDQKFGHWFDGDGMVHAISFAAGRVHYKNRYVRTPKYLRETRANRITERSFGHDRPGGILANAGRLPANCANTGVVVHGGKLLALWEGGHPFELDPVTLETIGPYDFDGALGRFDAFSAHGSRDVRTGHYYNFGLCPSWRGFRVHLYDIDPAGRLIARGSFAIPRFAFVHDFALTAGHMVFFVSPLGMKSFVPYMAGLRTFDASIAYDPRCGMRIFVVRLRDLRLVQAIDVDPFLVVHFGNAWEDGDGIELDLVRLESFRANLAMRDVFGVGTTDGGTMWRYVIDRARGRVTGRPLSPDVPCEFPTWDARFAGRASRFVYAAALLRNETPGFFNGVQRVDTVTGEVTIHDFGPGRFTSEALFVPASPDAPEGVGHLIAVVYRAALHRSEIVILDARDLAREVAVIPLENHVPFGFHGTYTPACFM
jgi:all-trans-8'-apo-beta-carotenal 15,15'-oxygenase